jgi:hypothetical protein
VSFSRPGSSPNEETIPVVITVTPLYDDGRFVAKLVILHAITESRSVEKRYQALIEATRAQFERKYASTRADRWIPVAIFAALPHPRRLRAALLAALEAVDYVTIFNETTPHAVLQKLHPDLLVKGGTYRENDIGVAPHQYYGAFSNIGEKYIVDGGYISLRELTIGYTFNSSLLSSTPFNSVKVSAVGRNLLYLKQDDRLKEMGLATESSAGRGIGLRGVEHMNFPLLRTIGFNVNLQF